VANTLNGNVTDDDTTITLSSTTGFPSNGYVKINSEIILYSNVSGNDLQNCVRAQFDTTATAHTSGDAVTCATIIVSDTGHGCNDDDFVTFSGAVSLGDQITADILNQNIKWFTSKTTTPITSRRVLYRRSRASPCLAV
jgi:hypothetical protein